MRIPDVLENRNKIKILICDDSAFLRVTLRRIIESDPGIQVIDIARNGEEAIEKAIRLKPDVIALDLHMPVVDGLTALKDIVRLKIAPVIMLSAATTKDAPAAREAMAAGAFDFIVIPDDIQSMDVQSAAIIQKLKQAAASNIYGKLHKNQPPIKKNDLVSFLSSSPLESSSPGGKGFKAAALGLSTGGPLSTFKVLPHLPHFSIHLFPQFSRSYPPIFQYPIIPGNCGRRELSSSYRNFYFVAGWHTRHHPETNENQHHRTAQHRGSPRRGVSSYAYISGSRAHDSIDMVHGNGYLKGFKAANSQTPNLPSPPFPFLWSPQPGSSSSLIPPLKFKGPKTTRTQRHTTQLSVTSIVSLCPGGAL